MKTFDLQDIQNLLDNPRESLSVEIKADIDLDTPKGKYDIVRTLHALYNNNGGYLIIGIDDKTLQPVLEQSLQSLKEKFHADKIQSIISRYSSKAFEVSIHFRKKGQSICPVIQVPAGFREPVAVKKDLCNEGEKPLYKDDVYVRSLNSNNMPSSTKIGWKDWEDLLNRCFENREADIGNFLRRNLASIIEDRGKLKGLLKELFKEEGINLEAETRENPEQYLDACHKRFMAAKARIKNDKNISIPDYGSWEACFLIDGKVPKYSADQEFLQKIYPSNPCLTMKPMWQDSRNSTPAWKNPYVLDDAWEAFIADLPVYDYMILDPKGRFYLWRLLDEDSEWFKEIYPEPCTKLDFIIQIARCTEAIAVAMSFAKAMGCAPQQTKLKFAFRWKKLKGRALTASPRSQYFTLLFNLDRAHQDELTVSVDVPLDTPLHALGGYVSKVVNKLNVLFGGYIHNKGFIEEHAKRLIERRFH